MKPLARRFQALVLTLVFLGGSTSLPGFDVLLFHLHGEQSRATAHIESADGCASHNGHCTLGQPASAANALGVHAGPVQLVPATAQTVSFRIWLPVAQTRGVGFRSRAPPIATA
jgi:hypothetical protein